MIPVTLRHHRVHAELWKLTENGTKEWTGVVQVDRMSPGSLNDALFNLLRKGLIDWRHEGVKSHVRTFKIIVPPDDTVIAAATPRHLGGARQADDDGAFLKRLGQHHPEGFHDHAVKPSLRVYVPMVAGGWAR